VGDAEPGNGEEGQDEAQALDGGLVDEAEGDGGECAAGGEGDEEQDYGGLVADEVGVGVAEGVGGEPASEAGFEASVEEEEEGEADQSIAGKFVWGG